MSEWWQKSYPGGPMVAVPGFPRPLYPPDASKQGKKPSVDGPDVVAYKRAISRLGRWPWQPFDDSFSNTFSHGKPPGNVSDSGVEGCQRQQPELGESGWVGKATFNFLRAARIPEPLPHAGEPALDTTALNLIAEAWRLFGGNEPSGTTRADALTKARSQLGYVEGSGNDTPYGAWYGANGQPWCAMFCAWAYELGSPGGSSSFVKGSRYAYVPYILSDAQAHRYGLSITSDPIPGDLVLYDFDGAEYDHVGIFESGEPSGFKAIEGNTSSDDYGSQANGGGVYRRSRSPWSAYRIAFVRVAN